MPDMYEGVWWKCWSGGPFEGRNWLLGRPVVTHKHAYWQFLPDELISPFILPEQPDNLPSVKFRQRDPSLVLTWLALLASLLLQADLQAWHLGQEPHPQPALPLAPPLGLGEDQQQEPSSLWKSLRLGTGSWPLVPWKHARIKSPGILRPKKSLIHVGVCWILSELEPRPWLKSAPSKHWDICLEPCTGLGPMGMTAYQEVGLATSPDSFLPKQKLSLYYVQAVR